MVHFLLNICIFHTEILPFVVILVKKEYKELKICDAGHEVCDPWSVIDRQILGLYKITHKIKKAVGLNNKTNIIQSQCFFEIHILYIFGNENLIEFYIIQEFIYTFCK